MITYQVTCENSADLEKPMTVEEALNGQNGQRWRKAMQEELNSFYKNSAWTLTELPEGQKVIDSKWIFKVKKDVEGNVTRFKTRLVAKDFFQKKGIDYEDIFSPMVRHSTLKMLIALAAELDLTIEHLM